jgi:hypothetical protein
MKKLLTFILLLGILMNVAAMEMIKMLLAVDDVTKVLTQQTPCDILEKSLLSDNVIVP